MPKVILYGPQGCGKTSAARLFQAYFGCRRIIDEWDGRRRLPSDALAIISLEPPYRVAADLVIEYCDALQEICDAARAARNDRSLCPIRRYG